MATIINQFTEEAPFGNNFVYNLTPPSGYTLNSIKLITASGVITDIPVTNINGQTVSIPNLRERHRFEMCLDQSGDFYQFSFHFVGQQLNHVLELSTKLVALEAFNIFSNLTGISYQYAPAHSVSDWSGYASLTLSQLQTEISLGPATYSIRVNATGYVVGSHGGLILQYRATGTPPPAPTYLIRNNANDTVIWFKERATFSSITSSPAATLSYNLITAANSVLTESPFTTIAALNAAIAGLATNAQYGVQVWAAYTGANKSTTITLNLTLPPL